MKGKRRDELLDGVWRIAADRGFSSTPMSEIARELHCSLASLYDIAPSKESLMVLAIDRWAEGTFASLESRAATGETDAQRARAYFKAGAEAVRPIAPEFFRDCERFESVGRSWRGRVTNRYITRFVELLGNAEVAGEVRHVNPRFLVGLLRSIGFTIRDEALLAASGLTHEEAILEVDKLIWEGIVPCERLHDDAGSSRAARAKGRVGARS